MIIHKAQVYDPFMDGVDDLPIRLELLVSDVDLDTPSFEENELGWNIKHYKRLMEFESLRGDDDSDEVDFNEERILKEPVFPVTVSVEAGMWRELYMRVGEIRRMFRKMGRQYDLIPDATFARDFLNVWQIIDTDYLCAECVRDVQFRGLGGQIHKGRQVQVGKYLLRTLCEDHEGDFNYRAAAARKKKAGTL